ncbi:helicase [Microbacterium terrisoli]|uniref:helicase n=1 Tax=Microbacterium terrisoli TaxID=3242192 RepID=UPI0028038592|nr:helicase [Microbacterium protaetiae]
MTDVQNAEEVSANGGGITDPRAGRDAVIAELRARWLGPRLGGEELLDQNPVYAYLVGTLYPVEKGAVTGSVLSDQDDETESDDGADDAAILADDAGLLEDGDVTADDDADEDLGVNITGAFGWAPQSFGTSFVHAGATVTVAVSAGVYDHAADEQGTAHVWRRTQLEDTTHVDVSATGSRLILDTRARLSWRSRRHNGRRLTTFSLSNAAEVSAGEAKKHPDLCLFQASMSCTDDAGIEPYPQSDVHASDEDRELSFRYRTKPIYAIGHGVAVRWSPREAPTVVTTAVLPEVEVGAIRAKGGDGNTYRMRWLADDTVSSGDLIAGLGRVAEDYRNWIKTQEAQLEGFSAAEREIATSIITRQQRAAERIEEGIEVLQRDEEVRTAFRMANVAMRWQMLRQGGQVGAATRYGNELDSDFGTDEPQWRPFQLAFILAALASTVDDEHPDRELVDLIWFPTGGGKTEAYLGLAATEMIRRRLVRGHRGGGMAVLTRYTMRLLTAQQFQRAATLICALELMRSDDERLDEAPAFSIGLWLGNTTTPGTYKQARDRMREVLGQGRPENPFQLLNCPWCATQIMPERRTSKEGAYGVRATTQSFEFFCPDDECPFHDELPVQVVDEGIYDNPPTMLVATVDKLARLAWITQGAKLFATNSSVDQPSLVIQDELHLLSGPLGTVVGVYEAAIGGLLSWRGTAPKVVASTATTRASERQVRELMGKGIAAFPPSGLDADDNHFSEPDPDAPGRCYLGIMPQAHTPSWAVGQLSTEMLDAPVAVGLEGGAKDAYWTLVVYHNSLRELGRTVTILRDDVSANLSRRARVEGRAREIGSDGVHELNGNVDSAELTALLGRLALGPDQREVIDALATTNIMSVGVDVGRLGLMLVNGQPKTTAEYIQATSRVGRGATPGLVVTMFRSGKPRDRSVFESFGAYHDAYYRFVEPSSVAPWSFQARRRALRAALVILVRHGVGLSGNSDAALFDADSASVKKAVALLKAHVVASDAREAAAVAEEIDDAVLDWVEQRDRLQKGGQALMYDSRDEQERLLRQFTSPGRGWPVMNSMRNVDKVVKVRANGERNG